MRFFIIQRQGESRKILCKYLGKKSFQESPHKEPFEITSKEEVLGEFKGKVFALHQTAPNIYHLFYVHGDVGYVVTDTGRTKVPREAARSMYKNLTTLGCVEYPSWTRKEFTAPKKKEFSLREKLQRAVEKGEKSSLTVEGKVALSILKKGGDLLVLQTTRKGRNLKRFPISKTMDFSAIEKEVVCPPAQIK